jgi:hypothetical protein
MLAGLRLVLLVRVVGKGLVVGSDVGPVLRGRILRGPLPMFALPTAVG